jgi:hypothetical protein
LYKCKNERCLNRRKEGEIFCNSCLELKEEGQLLTCKYCAEDFMIRKKFTWEQSEDIGICKNCKEELVKREREK